MKKIVKTLWIIPVFLALLLCYSTHWVFDTYDNPSFEQILFHISEPMVGVETELLYDFLNGCLLISIIETVVIYLIMLIVIKKWPNKIGKAFKTTLALLAFIMIITCLNYLGFFEYLLIGSKESTFIEDNYVNPSDASLTFPEEKRNLIYIFVESLESSYLSVDEGGIQEENLIPELAALAKENISFSDTEKIGGAYQVSGTSWTTAAMVAHTAGIPLKMGRHTTNYSDISYFLGGAFSLGDILFMEGYNQTIMFGSDGDFGNRRTYFSNHGFYNIYDYYDAIKKGRIPEDYLVWWGYEDSKLFEFAKDEALELFKANEPFNLTLLTANTHHPDGFLEDNCPQTYDDKYKNVISCTSYQINEFVEWCKKQEFYKNTTIVIVGDHLTMANDFFDYNNESKRRVFNTIINSAVKPTMTTNRLFSTMDMFPTTLASLGVQIEGNRLGLGTNLFSEEKTLIEKYGLDKVNEAISYKSSFYNNELMLMDYK